MSTCAGISDGKLFGSTDSTSAASGRRGGGLGATAFGCSPHGGLAAVSQRRRCGDGGARGGGAAIAGGRTPIPGPSTRICDNVLGANSFQSTSSLSGDHVGTDGPLKKTRL